MKTAALRCFFIAFLLLQVGPAFSMDALETMRRAEKLQEFGRGREAAELFKSVYTAAPSVTDRARALVRLAYVTAVHLDDNASALKLYNRAVQEFPGHPSIADAYYNRGVLLFESGRREQALKSFLEYSRLYPSGDHMETVLYILDQHGIERPETAAVSSAPTADSGRGKEPDIRVGLRRSRTISLTFPRGVQIRVDSGRGKAWPAGTYSFSVRSGKIWSGGPLGGKVVLNPVGDRFIWNKRTYAGRAELLKRADRVLLVNELPLESYLLGVVPAEMLPSFKPQALMAQAVAARSFALYHIKLAQGRDYHVRDGTSSQVYIGMDAADERVRKAVQGTRGVVLYYHSNPILAYYHNHSGGAVEDDAEVWSTDLPYCRYTEDAISQNHRPYLWDFRISNNELAAVLRRNGYKLSMLRQIRIADRTASGRVKTFRLVTDRGHYKIKAVDLRSMLGPNKMKSTLCRVRLEPNGFYFTGKGHGHGVGMSQWGAGGLAEQGADYRTILAKYYPGTTPTQAW